MLNKTVIEQMFVNCERELVETVHTAVAEAVTALEGSVSNYPSIIDILGRMILPGTLQKVKEIVDILYLALKIGARGEGYEISKDTREVKRYMRSYYKTLVEFSIYVKRFGNDSWVALLKWKLAAFFASVHDDIVPAPPNDCVIFKNPLKLFNGHPQKYLRMKVLNDRKWLDEFSNTVLHGVKKAAPSVSDDMLDAASMETFNLLTTPPPIWVSEESESPIRTFVFGKTWTHPQFDCVTCELKQIVDPHRIEDEIRRTVRELFLGKTFSQKDLYGPRCPSSSANYILGRNNLGSMPYFDEERQAVEDEAEDFVNLLESGMIFENLILDPMTNQEAKTFAGIYQGKDLLPLKLKMGTFSDYLSDEFGDKMLKDQDDNKDLEKEGIFVELDPRRIDHRHEMINREMFKKALVERPETKIVALPESLKVRCITAGPPRTYYCLQPVQKFLWETLKNHPTFRLIGNPLTEDIVREVFSKYDETEFFVSGDYKKSTDNLLSMCSEWALKELFTSVKWEGFEDWEVTGLYHMMQNALTRHSIRKPGTDQLFEQQHGQLMGSVISFPFLCMLNAAVCRLSMELDKNVYGFKLQALPLLINGDDCIFKGSCHLMSIWEKIITCVGLSSSIGKTYNSQRIIVMNSLLFIDYERNGNWEKIPYVNMGLLFLRNKKGPCAESDSQLSAVHEELLENCNPDLRKRVHKEFIQLHKDRIDRAGVPPFMPLWAGGLGLKKPNISNKEKTAQKFYEDLKALSTRVHLGEKFTPPPRSAEWLTHKLAMKALRDSEIEPLVSNCFFETVSDEEGDRKVGEAYSYLIYAALMNPLNELHKEISKKTLLKEERSWWAQQRKSWNAARGMVVNGSLLSYESIYIQPNKPSMAVVLART